MKRCAALLALLAGWVPAQEREPFSFVVLGHLRGDPIEDTFKLSLLDETVDKCAAIDPDLVFLSGDNVWGDVHTRPANVDTVRKEWEVLDEALARIGAPVHRVPGNHDISDLGTRDLWNERYGAIPAAVRHNGSLFLLLSTAWIPEDGDTSLGRQPHGVPMTQAQLAFIDAELGRGTHDHAFVIVHHLHWWREGSSWWNDVHPRLVGKNVRAVIGGDYGPTKYSYREADGIRYMHTSIAAEPDILMLRTSEKARMLSHQLDTFLHFEVDGDDVTFDVRVVGLRDRKHSPARFDAVNEMSASDYIYYSAWQTSRRRWKLTMLLVGGGFAAGAGSAFVLSWIICRMRRPRKSP